MFNDEFYYSTQKPWLSSGMRFFADDDTGGGGDSKGDGDDKGNDDKGGDDGKKGDDDGGKKTPEIFEVKIGGETKLLTMDELKEHAAKSGGADALMREAAELRKGAASGIEIKEAFEKILKSDNVDASDIRKFATVMGTDPDEMVKMFEEELKKIGGGEKDGKVAGAEKVGREQLDEETRDIIDQAKADQITKAEAKILEMCKESVDKDEFFDKILIDIPDEEERAAKRDVVVRRVHRDVCRKILASQFTGEKFGTEMIQNSIRTERSDTKKFGIPSKSSKQDVVSNLLASLGPTGGLPAEVKSDEKIERVSSTEADYEDNVVKRLGQKMVQSLVKRKSS